MVSNPVLAVILAGHARHSHPSRGGRGGDLGKFASPPVPKTGGGELAIFNKPQPVTYSRQYSSPPPVLSPPPIEKSSKQVANWRSSTKQRPKCPARWVLPPGSAERVDWLLNVSCVWRAGRWSVDGRERWSVVTPTRYRRYFPADLPGGCVGGIYRIQPMRNMGYAGQGWYAVRGTQEGMGLTNGHAARV